MKYYITDPDTKQSLEIPENVSDSVISQYLDKKYIGVIGLGSGNLRLFITPAHLCDGLQICLEVLVDGQF